MTHRTWASRMARTVAFLAAGTACVYQVRLALADYWFQRGGAENLRRALSYSQGNVSYLQALAETGEEDRVELLQQELHVLPQLAQAWIELALRAEFDGDQETAKRMLVQASHVDRTWNTSWALTNYYYRLRDREPFWYWARESLRLAHGEYAPLFSLCSGMESSPSTMMQKLSVTEPAPMRAYIDYLRNNGQLADAVPVAHALLRLGSPPEDLSLLESVVDHLIDTGDGQRATALWNSMIQAKWVNATPTNNSQVIVNPQLTFPFAGRGFDWRIRAVDGLTTEAHNAGRGVLIALSGSQLDGAEPIEVRVPVVASSYRFSFRTDWTGRYPPTGLFWHVTANGMDDIRIPLDHNGFVFPVPPRTSILRIALRYERPQGVPRLEGSISVEEVLLEDTNPRDPLVSATGQRR